jgi:uncharacterized protein (TIGR03083 family)
MCASTVAAVSNLDLGFHYAQARQRVSELALSLSGPEVATPVAACPGWTVHDVVAHLVGLVGDAVEGRLKGIPTEEQTKEQVARHRDVSMGDMLDAWAVFAPPFEDVVRTSEIWPAVMDCVSHEHDIRAALNRPGNRDIDFVRLGAERLARSIDVGARVAISFTDGTTIESGTGDRTYRLHTTPFELMRLRLGRRTRDEVLALDWSSDATPIVDELFVFGPTPVSIGE